MYAKTYFKNLAYQIAIMTPQADWIIIRGKINLNLLILNLYSNKNRDIESNLPFQIK